MSRVTQHGPHATQPVQRAVAHSGTDTALAADCYNWGVARAFIGTSGWSYKHWRGVFYPAELRTSCWLSHYVKHFNTTEINSSFYHLPRESTYENWYRQTPPGFVFALKASRFITHIKRLHEIEESWKLFVQRAGVLRDKLGPVLLQFPPGFHATAENLERLKEFLGLAGAGAARVAFEFRHESCFAPPVLDLLRRYGAALVIAHSTRYPAPPPIATGSFTYLRFHGPEAMCASCYPEDQLRRWSRVVTRFLREGTDVYAYFNNDIGGHAVSNALALRSMVEDGAGLEN
jgi:uncharacterized protein YecE (DUF72 family)